MQQPPADPASRNEHSHPFQQQRPAVGQMVNLMYFGMLTFHAIRVAATYNLAGIIEAHGPLSVAELAEQTRTHAFSLFRLLRALASIGSSRRSIQKKRTLSRSASPRPSSPVCLSPICQNPCATLLACSMLTGTRGPGAFLRAVSRRGSRACSFIAARISGSTCGSIQPSRISSSA